MYIIDDYFCNTLNCVITDGTVSKYGYGLINCKLSHQPSKFRKRSVKTCHECIAGDTIEAKCIDCDNTFKKRTKSKRRYCDQCCNIVVEATCNTCDQQFKTPKYTKIKKCNSWRSNWYFKISKLARWRGLYLS